jgi:hypothetical protein
MKKLLTLVFLLPLAAGLPLESANAFDKNKQVKISTKNKSAQKKVYKHHERNWHQRDYANNIALFKCYDSWGHNLRGKFTQSEQYLIELGGGSCRKITRQRREQANLSQISHYDFSIKDVYQAINQIKHDYDLERVKFIEAEKVSSGYKTFKYTLVFKTNRNGYREFRVKHNRRTGLVKAIYEV